MISLILFFITFITQTQAADAVGVLPNISDECHKCFQTCASNAPTRVEVGGCVDKCRSSCKGSVMTTSKACGINEEFTRCNKPIEASCAVPEAPHHPTPCLSGCVCKKGLYRDHNNQCVQANKCRNFNPDCAKMCHLNCDTNECKTQCDMKCNKPVVCPINEQFSEKVSTCPTTCEYPQGMCMSSKKYACECRPGFVRENSQQNAKCVWKESCSNCAQCLSQCNQPMFAIKCALNCQSKCNKITKHLTSIACSTCKKVCKNNLECEKGCLVLCKKEDWKCGQNEESAKLVSGCPETCSHPEGHCLVKLTNACKCKHGFVRKNSNFMSDCVLKTECPKKTSFNSQSLALNQNASHQPTNNTPLIVGLAVAAVVLLACLVFGVVKCVQKKKIVNNARDRLYSEIEI